MNGHFEIKRKFIHVLSGVVFALLFYFGYLKKWHILVLFLLGLVIAFAHLKFKVPFFSMMLEKFERPEHLVVFPGRSIHFLLIAVYILSFFPKNIAAGALMIWAFGDSISAIVCRYHEGTKHPLNDKKIIEGTVAGIVAGTLASWIFVPLMSGFIASIVAMFVESVDILFFREIDDNFIVPMIAAIVLSVVL